MYQEEKKNQITNNNKSNNNESNNNNKSNNNESNNKSNNNGSNNQSNNNQNKDPKTLKKNKIEKRNDECLELKNINYKNMLIKGSNLSDNHKKYDNNILDQFLEEECKLNKKEHWIKLDKPDKLIKLKKYGLKLIEKYNLNDDEIKNMDRFFESCIELKKITKIKDIEYNKELCEIISIPIILFNEINRIFYIKKSDKHVSTLKSVPVKKNKTIKT